MADEGLMETNQNLKRMRLIWDSIIAVITTIQEEAKNVVNGDGTIRLTTLLIQKTLEDIISVNDNFT